MADEEEPETSQQAVTAGLCPAPVMVDEIIYECQMSHVLVTIVVLEPELEYKLERHPGNRFL